MHLRVLGNQYLHECINIELKIGGKLCYIIALYRSLSQSQDEFEKFSEKLQLNFDSLVQNNPFLMNNPILVTLMRNQKTGIKITSGVSKGTLLRMLHCSSLYKKLLRNQRIF